jgi:hypothetical protein
MINNTLYVYKHVSILINLDFVKELKKRRLLVEWLYK